MFDLSPTIVAELSGNHRGDLTRAKNLIDLAKTAGANCVKLQTYQPRLIAIDSNEKEFVINDPNSAWHGRSLFDLYSEGTTPLEWHDELFSYSRSLGLEIFSTPFDIESVDFLDRLGCTRYKVASFEITYKQLIQKVSSTGKPIIISTGLATIDEISEAVTWAREAGAKDLTLLKCTSSYPAPTNESNILAMPELERIFDTKFGFSDHTIGFTAACAATALGAAIIEKHITLDSADGALDSAFSSDLNSFPVYVKEIRKSFAALGSRALGPTESEKKSLGHRRSIFFKHDFAENHTIKHEDLIIVRPMLGLAPKHEENIVGRQLIRPVKRNAPVSWEDLS
jgi:N-acetylneuraminate synthase